MRLPAHRLPSGEVRCSTVKHSAGAVSIWLDRTSAMSIGEGRMELQIHCYPASPTPSVGINRPIERCGACSAEEVIIYTRL